MLEHQTLIDKINVAFSYDPLYELTKKLRSLGYTYDSLVKLNEEGHLRVHPGAKTRVMEMIKNMDTNVIYFSHEV